jgi:hypothetical protein
MRVVEDVRQVVQGFLAPELRALKVGMDAQRQVMESNFRLMDARLDAIDQKIEHLIESLALDRRLAKLEAAQQPTSTQ